jgi:hypothetical protein
MLIDINVNEIHGSVGVMENEGGGIECIIGIGIDEQDPDESATLLTFIAHGEVDVDRLDNLIAGLRKFKAEVVKAAKKAARRPKA